MQSGTPVQDLLGIENHCYGCGPENPDGLRIKTLWDGKEGICRFQPRSAFMAGPTDVLNGGVIATIIDCHSIGTAIASTYEIEGRPIGSQPLVRCVTGKLEVEYLRPTPLRAPLILRASVESRDERRIRVRCVLSASDKECARALVVAVRVPTDWHATRQ
jgi:acyl-coenzyme A thioesterase PaaI-like protein